jgi:hypothetical protein
MLRRRPIGRVGRPDLLGTAARTAVVAGTATAVVGGVQRHEQTKATQSAEAEAYEQQQYADQVAAQQAAQHAAQQPVPQAAPANGTDTMAEIRQLADLKAKGLVSNEEFTAAKAKLLGI